MIERHDLHLHEDAALFRESVNFTAASTGFNPRLIEKDYFCTLLLAYLTERGGEQLVFKGGTCLAKVHARFYRLSEDLDFTIPQTFDANRTVRREAVTQMKNAVSTVADTVPAFTCLEPLTGANKSMQYNGAVSYQSPTTGQQESILVEVSVREPLLTPARQESTQTLLLDPIGGDAAVSPLNVTCISRDEAIAEKFRAALSRRDVAIRDFYDLDYAVRKLSLNADAPLLVDMVRQKLVVPSNLPVDVSEKRLTDLNRQLDTRLKSVLRDTEFRAFNLDRAFQLVVKMAKNLS